MASIDFQMYIGGWFRLSVAWLASMVLEFLMVIFDQAMLASQVQVTSGFLTAIAFILRLTVFSPPVTHHLALLVESCRVRTSQCATSESKRVSTTEATVQYFPRI